jgi:hypothetical protein
LTVHPELDDFRQRTEALTRNLLLAPHIIGDLVKLSALSLSDIAELARDEIAYYFLLGLAGLNRTSLKVAMTSPGALVVPKSLRRAQALKEHLPVSASFRAAADRSLTLREADLTRKTRGFVEALFRERLAAEAIALAMSPPVRRVPGLLVSRRKPDGVYPDPATGRSPGLYLEVKHVRRVADDIQKRLYEIAEASIEMKAIYGRLRLTGLELDSTANVEDNSELRAKLRSQIAGIRPIVVALLLCPKAEAERYREGAETFIDRVFFQEEISECVAFIKESIAKIDKGG